MGVPKFFRWLSERYPAISQLIAENRIPEFDCLYLDMNGIIHNCTHKDAGEDVSFRLSEEEMFIRIFNYIEHLFGKIKPKQLFFMAIDGVAPRAKMNQQRSRRFRTALDAEKAREKAIKEGVEIPKEEPFDSNCITPGTEFMAKLSQQLRYFVNKKVSEDTDWQGCEIVLSGHEVPGEGEHKIMEYIRNAKAQPNYNQNVRHCLYGLDADLIMLGLLSHDPHFCLLREEVTFGRASKTKSKELEHQNFYLLHLCIRSAIYGNKRFDPTFRNAPNNLWTSVQVSSLLIVKFVQDLADSMHLQWSTKEDDEGHRHLIVSFPPKVKDDADDDEEDDDDDEEGNLAAYRVMKTYDKALVIDLTPEDAQKHYEKLYQDKYQGWKTKYYLQKFEEWAPDNYDKELTALCENYVQGLQCRQGCWCGPQLQKRPTFFAVRTTHGRVAGPEFPFIDEKRLLAAMAPKNELLEPDEKARNGFGVPLKFTYSPEVDFVYPSPLPGVFPEIQNCRCIENIFDLPDMEGLEYLSGLTNGALLSVDALAGFPSLHTLPYTAQLVEGYGVNVFQADSRNPSICVTLTETENRTKIETWKAKIGHRCFVGYPFLQEAKVIKVQDELFSYEMAENGKDIVTKDHNNREAADWAKEADYLENWHAKRLAITIGQVECLVYVHMLKGLIRTEEGALIKEYAENPSLRSTYAAQTIVDEVVNEDERFIEKEALPIEEEFPRGTRAFFLGEYAYGRPLEVAAHANNKAEIVVSMLKNKEPDFAKQIIHQAERSNPYTPSFAVAKQLGIHPLVLSKITSSYQIINSAGLRLNLGLNLKFEGRKLKVLGYSRKSHTGWEFSGMAIKLIADYMVAFPDFFAAIQREPQKSEVLETDLWNDPSVASQRVKEIVAWLKKQETSKFERVPLEAEQLDSEVVKALANVGEQIHAASQDIDIKKLRGVPRSALLKPSDAEMVLGSQNFTLGDRVTYVSAAGKVPIATRGTVAGISRTATALLLDVVWDTSFMSGTTLNERAPMFRGQTVASSSVLNTTNKQVISTTSKSQQRRPVIAAQGGYANVGVTQYKDAPAPGPLRGGWRGALNGSNPPGRNSPGRGRGNGARGGAPNLMHSTLVYRNGPPDGATQGQDANGHGTRGRGGRGRARGTHHSSPGPDGHRGVEPPQEQRYGNVPPPASLDSPRGRGRGRGRGGRGRGGASRGRGNGGAAADGTQG
ncbi:exonuclease II [Fusarium oxysporum f. sp. lycopersici 4287]|uniref:5'-3' exoribonuclease 1 n=1 Tax=Fusarium oxysporum f. sp. lycopersici (strain 4287 / CBS 123668 / FGSC 9935 / NRRL 34936) TaxID=426428 RepID=A0A0J9UEH0_FUSO4|nr:exonuclease II [Fusarium oxysporum f. sp. lycopersici 4287]KNA97222.1 exonuclease II [Fusarium oxysporum f. sp. lycopersici 4287]